jgi:hypothetical protein
MKLRGKMPACGERRILGLSLLAALILGFPCFAASAEISGPELRLTDGDIFVSGALRIDEAQVNDLNNGISKKIIFYIDTFRVWKKWPDEFIIGKTLTRTLKCDPVKKEYIATSFDGETLLKKRFSGCKPLMDWALEVRDLKLASLRELEQAEYFVRLGAESRLIELPPVINYLLFFVREKEFSISRDSKAFPAGEFKR